LREDLSNYLFHWIKANSDDEAFDKLHLIIKDRKLLGSNGFIKGNFNCICFTETPLNQFHKETHRYKKFGVKINKTWLFEQGARPVIYQTAKEYDLLPNELRWKHVTFNPPVIDFSWEREWRINLSEFLINSHNTSIVVPEKEFGELLFSEYHCEEYRTCISAIAEDEFESFNIEPKPFKFEVVV
jgi:hypothetical protein